MSRKNALITGAAKRIGREIAIALSAAGWNVVVHYNKTKPDWPKSVQADLNNFGEVTGLVKRAQDVLGGEINLLINNASIFEKVSFAETSEDVFDRHMSLHVKAPFFLAQAFAAQTKDGQIINMLDTNIVRNKTTYFAYLLSKKSLGSLTQMLAVELAPNIRVNAVCPSTIEGFSSNLDKDYLLQREKELPMGKFANLQSVLDAILFLTTSQLTGQEIFVDGGEQLI